MDPEDVLAHAIWQVGALLLPGEELGKGDTWMHAAKGPFPQLLPNQQGYKWDV